MREKKKKAFFENHASLKWKSWASNGERIQNDDEQTRMTTWKLPHGTG
jgi:hypothetical protein